VTGGRESGTGACPEFRTEREDGWTATGQVVGYLPRRIRRSSEACFEASELQGPETVW
jgi:hypothetical protein